MSFVYFIIAEETGLVKIGKASDPQKRLRGLTGASPVKLRLLGTISGDADLCEKELHWQFRHLRVKGEWFRADPELLNFIEKTASPERIEKVAVPRRKTSNGFGRWLRENGISQTEFAHKLGVHPSVVSRYAGGSRKPDLRLFLAIQEETGGKVDYEAWNYEDQASSSQIEELNGKHHDRSH